MKRPRAAREVEVIGVGVTPEQMPPYVRNEIAAQIRLGVESAYRQYPEARPPGPITIIATIAYDAPPRRKAKAKKK